jgi:AAA+ superfamily predicted ATPase
MRVFTNGADHLLAELSLLDLRLRREVLRLRADRVFNDDPFRGLAIPDGQIDALLAQAPAEVCQIPALRDEIDRLTSDIQQRTVPDQPLPRLIRRCGLSRFEAEVLILALAGDVDARYETLFAYAQNDVTRKRPSLGLALNLLCESPAQRLRACAAFQPRASLFRHRLIRFGTDAQDPDPSFPSRPLRAESRIVNHVLGIDLLDTRVELFCRLLHPERGLTDLPAHEGVRDQLRRLVASFGGRGGACLFHGPPHSGRQAAAAAVCAELGRPLLIADACGLKGSGLGLDEMIALLGREAILLDASLYLHGCESLATEEAERLYLRTRLTELDTADVPVFLASATTWSGIALPTVRFPPLSFAPRLQFWEQVLNGSSSQLRPGDLAMVADKFRLGPLQIEGAAATARRLAELRSGDPHGVSADDLHAAARAQSGDRLLTLGRKVETPLGWDDLVVPPATLRQLRDVAASVRFRSTVLRTWGFERRLSYGQGITTLFSGPSGTGKTMAAAILARDLRLDLFAIDLSAIVSKYIGETEKNLARVFEEARTANAMLFFDEADALFGKRSTVKDAHDRYANIEVAFLLQKLEEFEGIVILATNMPRSMDDAFARRMQHAIEFPFPDAPHRERIWRGIFPTAVPLADDVDFPFLAKQFELSGGNICNVALAAAFRAAEQAEPLGMKHLVPTVARELQKMGRLPAKSDFREYYPWTQEGG